MGLSTSGAGVQTLHPHNDPLSAENRAESPWDKRWPPSHP